MNINYNDGLTRDQRMQPINALNKALDTHIKAVRKNIQLIDNASSIDIRTPYATTVTATLTGLLNTSIATQVLSITNTSNTLSALERTDIVAIMTDYADSEYTAITVQVTADRTAILAAVDVEIAALTAAGTPPTADKQDEMKRVALGYPDAADASAAGVLYYDNNVKSSLGFPDAASVLAARTSYTIKRKNTGLGFPFLVNILGGHNLPRATAVLSADAIDSINVNDGGVGYTTSPDVLIIGGEGSGATATANIAYRIVDITIDTPGSGYNSLRPIEIIGNGSGAKVLAELYNGQLYRLTILNGGSGYTTIPSINIINGNNSLGVGATASVTLGNGYVQSITVDGGGTGFTSAPSIEFVNNSFEGKIAGTLDGTGKITNLEITNAGSYYSSIPLIVFNPNGTGSSASASVTLKDGLLDKVTLLTAGTAYNSNEIIVSNTELLYDDYQLRVAFGYPNAIDSAVAEEEYALQAYRNGYGFPNAKDIAAAALDYFNMQLAAQLEKPSLITLTQEQQDQIYKDNFGYPLASSVNSARSSYRIQNMKDLLDGLDISKPQFDSVKKGRMTIDSSSNRVHETPIPKRKENQLQEINKKNQTMQIAFVGKTKETRNNSTDQVNKHDKNITKIVNDEVSEIYNQNSFYQRDLVVSAQYTNETTSVANDVNVAQAALIAATTITATSEANTLYADSEAAADLETAAMIAHNAPIEAAEIAALIANVDNNVDGIAANRNVYQQQINSKEAVITDKADEIKDKVEEDIKAYGTNNPPSQGVQDQMYKDAYGYPAAGSVADARQSYIDNNLKKELGFPNDTLADAKEKYIDLGIKTQLGYPDAANVAAAAVLAKAQRKKTLLGQPDVTLVLEAEVQFTSLAISTLMGYPQEVTKITVTNKGKGYKTPPLVVFDCIKFGDLTFIKPEAYSVLNSFGEVDEIVITYTGYSIEPTPTIRLVGGGGADATAIVANDIPTANVQAQAFYVSQYINTQFGYSDDGVDSTGTKQKYINNEIIKDLGYGGFGDLDEAKTLYFNREYQSGLGFPDSNPDKTRRYILDTEAHTKINGFPTDFLKRYDIGKYLNITDNNAAELMYYYTQMQYYLVNALPGKTLEYINQIYKDDFGYPGKALALATLTGGNTIDTITVTNPLENSGYAQSIPPYIYINNVLTDATVTVSNGRLIDISVTSSVVYTEEPTITIVRSFDLVDTAGNPASDSVVYGGSDYTLNPDIVLLGGTGTGAVFTTTVVDHKLVKVNVMMGGSYTELPDIEVRPATGDYGRGAKVNIILNSQGKIETYIPVSNAQDKYTSKRINEISTTQYDLSIKSTLTLRGHRSMGIITTTITHDERVYGRKPLSTETKISAMILRNGYAANLSNPSQNKSMSISNTRPLMTRQNRLSQANNYTTFYRQAEAYVKFKVIEGANADPIVTYTPAEKHDMLFERLALIKGKPRPKQKPTINDNIGKSFGTIDNIGTSRKESLTHNERVGEHQTRAVVQKAIDLIISDIEIDNGGKVVVTIENVNVVVPPPPPGADYTIVGVITDITIVDRGQNFKYAPRVRIISPTGIEAYAEATLNADKSLASIDVTNGGSGYLATNTTIQLLISAEEKSELEDKYWWSIVRANQKKREDNDPEPPNDIE